MIINVSKQDLKDYYITKKLSTYKIAEIYNCSNRTILNRMIEYNILRRTKSEARKGMKFTEEHKRKIGEKSKGRKHTEKSKKKMSEANKGENHPRWKGNDAGYIALHQYIKRNKPKPERCEICGKITNDLDCSNKDHKYTRNFEDYQYICRKCHRLFDKCMKK